MCGFSADVNPQSAALMHEDCAVPNCTVRSECWTGGVPSYQMLCHVAPYHYTVPCCVAPYHYTVPCCVAPYHYTVPCCVAPYHYTVPCCVAPYHYTVPCCVPCCIAPVGCDAGRCHETLCIVSSALDVAILPWPYGMHAALSCCVMLCCACSSCREVPWHAVHSLSWTQQYCIASAVACVTVVLCML
jgi:hypothetical protein